MGLGATGFVGIVSTDLACLALKIQRQDRTLIGSYLGCGADAKLGETGCQDSFRDHWVDSSVALPCEIKIRGL